MAVPARPEFIQVIRSVVGSVASHLDFSYDGIEDLQLAVDEACSALLTLRPAPSELNVVLSILPDVLELVVCADAEMTEWPTERLRGSLAWKILSALTDEAQWEKAPQGPALRFSKRLVPRAEAEAR
jgi:serine/threonine-protein kinase RsbW